MEAYGALEQAVRLNRNSWKVWDNFLSAALVSARLAAAGTRSWR
jgi:hypothetical protein